MRIFFILSCLACCFSCSTQKRLYKSINISDVLKDTFDEPYFLLPVFINGEMYEMCSSIGDVKYYLRSEGFKDENIEQLIRDVYRGKKKIMGTDFREVSYTVINKKYYDENFRDADLQDVLKKYMRFDVRRDNDKQAMIKHMNYGKEFSSLAKYFLLNNFSVSNNSYGHDMEIVDLNNGKKRIPLKRKKE